MFQRFHNVTLFCPPHITRRGRLEVGWSEVPGPINISTGYSLSLFSAGIKCGCRVKDTKVMHDFQSDVSHLERLAELWLRTTRRRDKRVGVNLRSTRNLPRSIPRNNFWKTFAMHLRGTRGTWWSSNILDMIEAIYCVADNYRNTRRKWHQVLQYVSTLEITHLLRDNPNWQR